MRPIKFRAWYEGEMIFSDCAIGEYNFECNFKGELVFYAWNDTDHTWDLYTDDIMQFTGLQDKMGVEIYEGDIIKVSNISVVDSNSKFTVVFEEGAFGFYPYNNRKKYSFYGFTINSRFELKNNKSEFIRIVGHKYE